MIITIFKQKPTVYNSTVPVTFYVPSFWPQVSLSLRCLCCVPMRTTCTQTCAQRCLHVHVGSLGVGGYFTEQKPRRSCLLLIHTVLEMVVCTLGFDILLSLSLSGPGLVQTHGKMYTLTMQKTKFCCFCLKPAPLFACLAL